jgi:methyl-accepting chemotaxis protein
MEQQSAATKEIAHSVQQAAAGTAEVSSTITSVTQAADESRGASGQVLDAARELATQADSLRREVTSFVETVRKA